jgi:hypothetical protein
MQLAMYVAMAKESAARAILQWLIPSNVDVMLILTMGLSGKEWVLHVNEEDRYGEKSESSVNEQHQ